MAVRVLTDIRISVEADTEASRFLTSELLRSNTERIGDGKIEVICIAARNAENDIVGGVHGELYWGWLNILVLWVTPSLRRHGLATRLLAQLEDEAVARRCHGIYLDTFTFQSPSVYLKLGYEVFGTLEHFPSGHSRQFLRKQLPTP
jgi:GNAT superfamily N-acetyltransferase